MRRSFIAVPLVLLVLLIALGFFRGWFVLSNPDPVPGVDKVNVNLTVDKEKMQEDADTVKRKSKDLTDKVAGREQTPAAPPTTVTPTVP